MSTVEEKVLIVHKLLAGIPANEIADTHQITIECVTCIDQNFHAIMEVFDYKNKTHHLPMKGGLFPQMENILFAWFSEQRDIVSNKRLAEKAKQILEILNETSRNGAVFCGSNNWANAFRKRLNIAPPAARRKSTTTFNIQTDIVVKSEPELTLNDGDSNQGTPTAEFEAQTEMVQDGLLHIESVFSFADDIQVDAIEGEDDQDTNSNDVAHADPDLSTSDENVNDNDVTNEILNVPAPRSKKRKRPTVIVNSSDEFSDSDEPPSEKKRYNGSEMVLVPSRNGVKSMSLQDYNEDKVIRIFKPVLKFAKVSGWSREDSEIINRLYRKSLKSCNSSKKAQSTITEFFRQKK